MALFAMNLRAEEVKLVAVGTAATQTSPDFFDNKTYKSGDESYSVNISVSGTSKSQGGSYGTPSVKDYYYSMGSACDMSSTVSNYFKVSATGCKISKIVVRAHSNSTSTAIMPAVGFVSGMPETSKIGTKSGRYADVIISNQTPPSYGSIKQFDNAGTLTYTFTTNVSEVYFSKQIKQVALSDAEAWSTYPASSAQSVCVYGMDVYVVPDGPAKYNLAWNLDGGNIDVAGTTEGSYAAGTAITAPTVSKTGYTFNGWNPEVPATMPAANSEYTAQWTVNTHKLVWDFDGGNTSSTTYTEGGDAIAYGTTITYPADNTMTKDGYDFIGWDNDDTSMPDADLTITAQWQAEAPKYDITFAKGDNTSATVPDAVNASNVTLESIDSDNNYRFDGWKADVDVHMNTLDGTTITAGTLIAADTKVFVTAATTFTAQWTPKYAVSFNSDGGSAVATQYIVSGETAEEPTAPTKDGYAFKAWQLAGADYNFSTAVTAAIELKAVYNEIETYTAEFSYSAGIPEGWTFANAGSYADNVATVAYVGTWVANNVSTPKQTGKTTDDDVAFAKKAGACATYDLGQTTSVTALSGTFRVGSSSERTFTIEYLAANGTTVLHTISTTTNSNWGEKAVSNTTVVPNVKYIRINPAHNGDSYSWLVMQAFSVSYINTITKYNVTFSKNGGSGDDMPTLKYAEGAEVTLPACTFTAPTGKEFDAWACADSTITGGKFTMPAADVEIRATWKDYELNNDATLKSLKISGVDVVGFKADSIAYAFEVPYALDTLPKVTAEANDEKAKSVVITNISEIPGTATVVVTAEDNITTKTYSIAFTRKAAATGNAITSFKLNGIAGSINTTNHTVTVEYPNFLGEVTSIKPLLTISELATVVDTTVAKDFSSPVIYTVTSEAGLAQEWTVTVNVGPIPSLAKENMPYESAEDWTAAPNWMYLYDASFVTNYQGGDYQNHNAIRINAAGAVYMQLEACDSIKVVASATGTRSYRLEVVGGTAAVQLDSKGKNIGWELNLPVASENPVLVKFTTPDANGGATVRSVKVYWTKKSGTALDNTADEIKAVKVLENGQLFIRRGVKVYTITGELVK